MNFRNNNRTQTTAASSRSSAALVLTAAKILAAAFGGSSIFHNVYGGNHAHARMLLTSEARAEEKRAQIDAFYAKYFAGGSPKEA